MSKYKIYCLRTMLSKMNFCEIDFGSKSLASSSTNNIVLHGRNTITTHNQINDSTTACICKTSICMLLSFRPTLGPLRVPGNWNIKNWISHIMRNVKMNVYVDFGGVSVKRGWKNASGPLPDHLAPQPDRNLKFWLHSSLDFLNTFLTRP